MTQQTVASSCLLIALSPLRILFGGCYLRGSTSAFPKMPLHDKCEDSPHNNLRSSPLPVLSHHSMRNPSLKIIGIDAMRHVLSFASPSTLCTLSECSKDLYLLCTDPDLWTQLHLRVFKKTPIYEFYPKLSYYTEIGKIVFPELFLTRGFVSSQSAPAPLMKCCMVRKEEYFVMRLEEAEGVPLRLAFRKRSRRNDLLYAQKIRGKYYISYNHPRRDEESFLAGVLATVESDNLTKTRYIIRDNKRNAIISQVSFDLNPLGIHGPRMFNVTLPELDKQNGMQCRLSAAKLSFSNCSPQYDRELKSHVLDLHGRATESSVMNFKIQRGEEMLWLCGKRTGCFSVDFRSPFTPVSAFGLALASHATKSNRLLVSLRS